MVFAELEGAGVNISDFQAVGCPSAPRISSVWPESAEQGDDVALYVTGSEFRNVGINVDLLKSNATGDGDTGEVLSAKSVDYDFLNPSKRVVANLTIPDLATIGLWNVTCKHSDDPAVARLNNAFTVLTARPKITGISINHARRNEKIHMLINGKFFRNPAEGITVQLKRYGKEVINSTKVVWRSKNLVEADFTIPSTATIGADWDVFLQHNDDMKNSTKYFTFSVDAKLDIKPHVIWQHAPWYLSVRIYSETGFDATTINPNSVSMGGIIPYWYQLKDLNWDGKKDMELRFWNSFVTIPVGFNRTVVVAGRTSSWVPIKAYDTVDVFWFLF